eukprot:3941500-Rhodomonas_salina.2
MRSSYCCLKFWGGIPEIFEIGVPPFPRFREHYSGNVWRLGVNRCNVGLKRSIFGVASRSQSETTPFRASSRDFALFFRAGHGHVCLDCTPQNTRPAAPVTEKR